MKIKTSELEGAALDWAVAKAINGEDFIEQIGESIGHAALAKHWSPSTNWSQGGQLIERFRVSVSVGTIDRRCAVVGGMPWYADKPLIAAMRAIVAAELGDTVDVPEELLRAP